MNESNREDSASSAQQRLRDACRARDKAVRLAWAITLGEGLLLAVVAIALIDYWLMVPVHIRNTGAAVLAGLALFGLWRLVRFYRRPSRLKEAALEVEAQRPELGCEISTAAEYASGERQPKHEYEPELAAALQAHAAAKLRPADLPFRRKLRKPVLVLAVTLLLLALAALLMPGLLTAFARAAFPFLKTPYTTVEVQPGSVEIPVGRDVAITNLFLGREPKDAQLHWRQGVNPTWQTAALKKGVDGRYVHPFKSLAADVTYRVTGSDAVSGDFAITTFVPPAVKDLGIRITHPEYTKLKPTEQKAPEISVVRASTASFRIEPTTPLARARLRFSNQPEVPLAAATDGSWTGSFQITQDTEYWIELADAKGRRGGNEKPYRIKAVPDAPPKVEITEPGQDIRAANTNVVALKISAADDFGVAEVKIVYHKLGGPEQTLIAQPVKEENGEMTATAELDLSKLNLSEYELVAYHAEARDFNNVDGPGIGKSGVFFIEITNEEGGACKSQCKGQKVNLLVIQKQIIAETTALAAGAAPDKFKELAARQRDATEFGRTYLETLPAFGAPAAAVSEMEAAVREMELASGHLDGRNRSAALPPEESALAHFYQVLKLLPELEDLPIKPPVAKKDQPPPSDKVKVVLEAIKNKKKEEQDNKAIEQALQEAQDLKRQQAGVNSQCQNPGQSPSPGESQSKGEAQNESKSDSKLAKEGKGKGQSESKSEGQGQGEGNGESEQKGGKPGDQLAEGKEPKSPLELAGQQEALSREALALAEKLQRLAGKDTRVGHNAGKNAALAAEKMAAAAQSLKQGNAGAGGIHGVQSEQALRRVIAQLERILQDQPEFTDVANEEFPREYEAVIAEYLKKLSYAE